MSGRANKNCGKSKEEKSPSHLRTLISLRRSPTSDLLDPPFQSPPASSPPENVNPHSLCLLQHSKRSSSNSISTPPREKLERRTSVQSISLSSMESNSTLREEGGRRERERKRPDRTKQKVTSSRELQHLGASFVGFGHLVVRHGTPQTGTKEKEDVPAPYLDQEGARLVGSRLPSRLARQFSNLAPGQALCRRSSMT